MAVTAGQVSKFTSIAERGKDIDRVTAQKVDNNEVANHVFEKLVEGQVRRLAGRYM